ncbi:MAG TPA: AsmA family protein, partial [Candidatus Sulfotelmatobacter sp.]|nr:AsmA family protein [Candidatus Sulfotelmatobacter sp.]
MKKIKKIILGLVVIFVVLLIIAVITGAVFLGQIVKTGIERVTPPMTKTSVTVDSVGLSILSGGAGLNNFVIGNPDPANYQSTNAISVGKIAVSLEPKSLFGDKIVIHSVEVRSPDITFEGNPFGKNNLQTIMDNVNAAAGGTVVKSTNTPAAQPAQQAGAGKKIEVDDFVLAGAKVTARITDIGSTPIVVTLTIPDIHFTNLGTGPDGITVA